MTLQAGVLVRIPGLRGTFKAVRPCQSGSGCWWFHPCDRSGTWRGGHRAFRPEQCQPVRRT